MDPENEGWGGGSGYCSAKSPEGNEWTAGLGKWSDGVDLVAGEMHDSQDLGGPDARKRRLS